jgi:uncharacterized delta-60 repeat protein
MTLPLSVRLFAAWWLLLLCSCSWPVVTRAQSLDPDFAPTRLSLPATTTNAVQQADGRLIISVVPPAYYKGTLVKGLIRVNLDGSLDQTFGSSWLQAGGAAGSMRVLPNGNILLVGGSLSVLESLGGLDLYRQTGVVVLHPDGTLNRQFTLRLDSEPTAGEVQPDGKLLIGGNFTTVNGTATPRLARLLPTGQLDPSFTLSPGGFNGTVTSIQVQPDGKIMVGGDFTSYGGAAQAHLVRLLPNGGLDPSFQAAIPPAAFFDGFAVQPDGKVVVNAISLATGQGLFRLLPTGSRDNTFASSTYSYVALNPQSDHHVVVQPSGNILLAGSFQQANGQPCPGLVRVSPTGTLDTAAPYQTDNQGVVTALCLLADGSTVACGGFTIFNHQRAGMVQIAPAGQVSPFPLPVENIGHITAVLPLEQGRLLVGGNFNTINGVAAWNLAFLRADGTVDVAATQALPPIEGPVKALAPGPLETAYVGGEFYESAVPSRCYLLRLTRNGSQDRTFTAPSLNSSVSSLATYPDGRLLIGGSFSLPKDKLLRLTAQGGLDPSFLADFGTYVPWVNALVLQRNERLALLTSTTAWQLTPQGAPIGQAINVPRYLHALTVQPDGGILVAGEFTDFGGTAHNSIVRLLPTGVVDASFDAGTVLMQNGIASIQAVAAQDDGRILCAGYFTSIQGQAHRGIARLLASGQVDNTFADQVLLHPETSCLVLQAGGRLLVGTSALDPQSPSYLQPLSMLTQGLTCLRVPGLSAGSPPGLPLATAPAPTSAATLSIYPVPAQQEFTVAAGSATTQLSVVIYDVLGQLVRQHSGTAPSLHISVMDLAPATYVLCIRANQTVTYRKLVVQH